MWIYTATGAGVKSVSANTRAYDDTLGNTIVSSADGSNVITIENAVSFDTSLAAAPAQVSVGQEFTVIMQVTNTGQAEVLSAIGVTPVVQGLGAAVPFTWP